MCRCDGGAQLQPRFVLTAIREQLCGPDVICTAAVDGTVVLQQLELVRAAGLSCLSCSRRYCVVGWRGFVAHRRFSSALVALATGVFEWLLHHTRWKDVASYSLLRSTSGSHQAVLQLYRLVRRDDSRRSGAHRCGDGRARVVHPFC